MNVTHFLFLPVKVVLYDALLDAVVAIVLVAALLFGLAGHKLPTSSVETGLALAVGFLIAVVFAILVPTVIDRSLSVYILEKLDQRGGGSDRTPWRVFSSKSTSSSSVWWMSG